MEKSWENFWTTGKVEDYLSYRNRVTEKKEENDLSCKGMSDKYSADVYSGGYEEVSTHKEGKTGIIRGF